MLSNISWQGYWTFLALTTILYYAVVSLLFFRNPILRWIHGRLSLPLLNTGVKGDATQQSSTFETTPPANASDEGPETIPAVHSLIDEIHAFFESKTAGSYTKDALVDNLKTIVRKYPTVKGTPYQQSVNNLLLFLAEYNGALYLNAEEVGSVWL